MRRNEELRESLSMKLAKVVDAMNMLDFSV